MAKIEYIICDRCKRKIDYEDFYELKMCEVPKEPEVTGVIKFDICEDYRKKFYEFLKEGKVDG